MREQNSGAPGARNKASSPLRAAAPMQHLVSNNEAFSKSLVKKKDLVPNHEAFSFFKKKHLVSHDEAFRKSPSGFLQQTY